MGIVALYGNGFVDKYDNDEHEVRVYLREPPPRPAGAPPARPNAGADSPTPFSTTDLEDPLRCWAPWTADFQAAARHYGRETRGVASFDDFVGALRRRRRRRLSTVYYFGHGAGSGYIKFGDTSYVTESELRGVTNADVSANFEEDGVIYLYVCNVGLSQDFVQVMAGALRVRVCAPTVKVEYQLQYTGQPRNRRITGRGVTALPTEMSCASPASP